MRLALLLLLAGCQTSDPDCLDDQAFFETRVAPIFAGDCIACHNETGLAQDTRHILEPFDGRGMDRNRDLLEGLIRDTEDFGDLLLLKPVAEVSHGGGRRFGLLDERYAVMHEFVARTRDPGHCEHPGDPPPTCEPGDIGPGPSPLRRLTDIQAERAMSDLLAIDMDPGVFPVTALNEDFRTFATNNTVDGTGAESLMLAAELAASRADLDALRDCEAGESAQDCTRRFLVDLATRAFRRPLSDAERDLVTAVLDHEPPDDAARMGIELIFQSPQFLYLDLAATPLDGTDAALLDDYAIATRVSLFLTDGPPDDQLWEDAVAGQVHTREQVRGHALRLLEDGRLIGVVQRFHRDWLNLYQLGTASKDAALYPEFSPELVDAMIRETDLFTGEVVWLGEGTYDALMFGETTWVDPQLATLYAIDAVSAWERAELGDSRPGVLTRSAFLTAHAYNATSSPVRRGAFVIEELLCEDLQPPADVNMDIPDAQGEADTIRERLELHWTDPTCAACHSRIDPIGFAFEYFGAVGEERATWEDGTPIDATGSLESPVGEWEDAAGMLEALASTPRARSCYARRWFEYATGRPADVTDACTLNLLETRFEGTDGDIRSLLVDIALSDAFLYRPEVQ